MSDPKDSRVTSTDGHDPDAGPSAAPGPINPDTGQHESYWVLTEEERAKGFVRPVRQQYKHVGIRPRFPLRPLTEDEKQQWPEYTCYEEYPKSEHPALGRYWTEKELSSGCGAVTIMARAIAETYAREPSFYGATFCIGCGVHLPVGAKGEFVWVDEHSHTTNERVGT